MKFQSREKQDIFVIIAWVENVMNLVWTIWKMSQYVYKNWKIELI